MNLGLSKGLCRSEPGRKFLAIVKRKIAKQPIARSVVGVQQQVTDVWGNIPLRTIQGLIYSSRGVLLAVIAVKGEHKKY